MRYEIETIGHLSGATDVLGITIKRRYVSIKCLVLQSIGSELL